MRNRIADEELAAIIRIRPVRCIQRRRTGAEAGNRGRRRKILRKVADTLQRVRHDRIEVHRIDLTQQKLLAALLLCLAGDVLLMLPGLFIPGLVSFLCAHLCYLALFRQGQRWFPSGTALAASLAAAVVMYAILFPHLGPVLKGQAEKAANLFPSAASSSRSSCATAAPEMTGIGGEESRSWHMPY